MSRRRTRYEDRIFWWTLAAALPGLGIGVALLAVGGYDRRWAWPLACLLVGVALGCAAVARHRAMFPLQTLAGLLQALREGDYSLRARGIGQSGVLGDVMREVNGLGDTLMEQRLGAVEATAMLRTVIDELDLAIFTFDGAGALRLVNPAGERLLAQPAERLLGTDAVTLGLAEYLTGEPSRTVERAFPGGEGRWGMRRSSFRESGLPHHLLVLADLSRALREEERQAWQRLIRVLGHELGNSLTPIKSMAGTLADLLGRSPRPADLDADLRRGLEVIAGRSDSLARFMAAYSRLARLPAPRRAPVAVAPLLHRVAALEGRLPVAVGAGPDLTVNADADQLEQLLVNLLRNAVDAAIETAGGVQLTWQRQADDLLVRLIDDGPGLPETANLFVPFFTTKPGGSGIGLVLSRQIAEAHGGSLALADRTDGRGCEARLRLPLYTETPTAAGEV